MVLHAGIICDKIETKFIIFNAENCEQVVHKFDGVDPDNVHVIDDIFDTINLLVNDQFGCLCICLENYFDGTIRDRLIQAGKDIGFKKIEITDPISVDFISLISASNAVYKTRIQEGNSIWVFCGNKCRIWIKDENVIKFVKELKYEDTVESLQRIKKLVITNPDMILYEAFYDTSHHILEEMFRQNVRLFSFINPENGVIIKARIVAGDRDVMCYNTESLFGREELWNNENDVINEGGSFKNSYSEYTFIDITPKMNIAKVEEVTENFSSIAIINNNEEDLSELPNDMQISTTTDNNISIFDDDNFLEEEPISLTESPILAALARLQPLPKY